MLSTVITPDDLKDVRYAPTMSCLSNNATTLLSVTASQYLEAVEVPAAREGIIREGAWFGVAHRQEVR